MHTDIDRQIDRYSYLYSAYKSKESLGASVAKKMCFQRSSKRIEGESRPPKPGWKVIPQSRTGSRETPVAKFVVCSWHNIETQSACNSMEAHYYYHFMAIVYDNLH